MKIQSIFMNSSISVISKLLISLINFLAVPILINIMGVHEYGIWVTVTSVLVWLQLSDLGIANSLKNKVTERLSNKDKIGATEYFAGAIILFSIICLVLLIVVYIFVKCLNLDGSVEKLVFLLYVPYIFSLPFSLGSSVLAGARQVGIQAFLSIISPFTWILCILLLQDSVYKNSDFAVLWISSLLLGNLITFIYACKFLEVGKILENLDVCLSKALSLLNASLKFFALQVTAIMLFSMGNYLNYIYLGAIEAARYDTINKIFSLGITLFGMITSTFWPEFSYCFSTKQYENARMLYQKLIRISVLVIILALSGLPLVPYIIAYWTHNQIIVSVSEILPFALSLAVQVLAYCGAVVLNASEQMDGQILCSVIGAVIIVPTAAMFFSMNLGVITMPIAIIIATLPACIWCNFWASKLLTNYGRIDEERERGNNI